MKNKLSQVEQNKLSIRFNRNLILALGLVLIITTYGVVRGYKHNTATNMHKCEKLLYNHLYNSDYPLRTKEKSND